MRRGNVSMLFVLMRMSVAQNAVVILLGELPMEVVVVSVQRWFQ